MPFNHNYLPGTAGGGRDCDSRHSCWIHRLVLGTGRLVDHDSVPRYSDEIPSTLRRVGFFNFSTKPFRTFPAVFGSYLRFDGVCLLAQSTCRASLKVSL